MSGLVDVNGEPLSKDVPRRRQTSRMKKGTPHGDILFQLTVDAPKQIGPDDLNRFMVEYFGIGYEAFKAKL